MVDEQKKAEQLKKTKAKADKAQAAESKPSAEAPRHAAKERPRLRTQFEKEVSVSLMKELDLKNPMAVPRLNKIVVNMGVGEATQNAKLIDPAVNELGQITGQKACRLGRWLPCAATACTNFSTGWSPWCCRACEISKESRPSRLMAGAITPSACTIS
jgi:hypothetical protein